MIFKKLLRGLCSQTFKLAIFFVAISTATVVVFGSPGNIKEGLKDSGVYDRAADSILEQLNKNPEVASSEVPVNDPAIQEVVRDTLSPEFLEQTSTTAIDGIFEWLQGNVERPEFKVDLNDAKQRLANGVGDVAIERASKLPVCSFQQLQTIDFTEENLLSLPCVPPGTNLQTERTKLVNSIARGEEILKETDISAKNIKNEDGENIFDQANQIPTAYQWLVRLPWMLGGLALISAAGLLYLHDDRRRGLLVLGRALLVTGLILVVFALVVNLAFKEFNLAGSDLAQATAADVVKSFSSRINRVLTTFGIIYSVFGAGIMLALHFTKPKATASQKSANPQNK